MEEMLNFVDGEIQFMLNLFKYVAKPSDSDSVEATSSTTDGGLSASVPQISLQITAAPQVEEHRTQDIIQL